MIFDHTQGIFGHTLLFRPSNVSLVLQLNLAMLLPRGFPALARGLYPAYRYDYSFKRSLFGSLAVSVS